MADVPGSSPVASSGVAALDPSTSNAKAIVGTVDSSKAIASPVTPGVANLAISDPVVDLHIHAVAGPEIVIERDNVVAADDSLRYGLTDNEINSRNAIKVRVDKYGDERANLIHRALLFCNNRFHEQRHIIIEWMFDVAASLNLQPRTQHLAVNCLDRFVARRNVKDTSFQILGVACLLIAAKNTENYHRIPTLVDVVRVVGHQFDVDTLRNMELVVLEILSWDVLRITSYDVLSEFIKTCFRMKVQDEHDGASEHSSMSDRSISDRSEGEREDDTSGGPPAPEVPLGIFLDSDSSDDEFVTQEGIPMTPEDEPLAEEEAPAAVDVVAPGQQGSPSRKRRRETDVAGSSTGTAADVESEPKTRRVELSEDPVPVPTPNSPDVEHAEEEEAASKTSADHREAGDADDMNEYAELFADEEELVSPLLHGFNDPIPQLIEPVGAGDNHVDSVEDPFEYLRELNSPGLLQDARGAGGVLDLALYESAVCAVRSPMKLAAAALIVYRRSVSQGWSWTRMDEIVTGFTAEELESDVMVLSALYHSDVPGVGAIELVEDSD